MFGIKTLHAFSFIVVSTALSNISSSLMKDEYLLSVLELIFIFLPYSQEKTKLLKINVLLIFTKTHDLLCSH